MKQQKRIVIITGPGFEDVEVYYPYHRLLEEKMVVDVVTSTDKEVKGKHGVTIAPTMNMSSLSASDYDVVIIPGGHEAPDRVRQVKELVSFVNEMYSNKKIVSSICHGPWVLIEAGIVKGKKATCYPAMKTDLVNAGAIYLEKPVVVDGTLITSDHPRSLGMWMKETIHATNSQTVSDKIRY